MTQTFCLQVCPVCGSEWLPTQVNYRNRTCGQSCGNAMGSGTPWTAEQIVNLGRLYEQYSGGRVPTEEIAAILGKTPSAVRYKAHKLGLTDPHRPRRQLSTKPKPEHWRRCARCNGEFQVRAPSETQAHCSPLCAALGREPHRSWRNKQGRREDLGIYVRSSWEANYARYLKWLVEKSEILAWSYEPRTFKFPVERGNRSYTPDFLVTYPDGRQEWHEVKGYMTDDGRVKLKRFAKYYPTEVLVLIDGSAYRELAKSIAAMIPGWE